MKWVGTVMSRRGLLIFPFLRASQGLVGFCLALLFAFFTVYRLLSPSLTTTTSAEEASDDAGIVLGQEESDILLKLFPKIDADGSKGWTIDEMEKWIVKRVNEHVQSALKENLFLFTAIDSFPRDGHVSWKEYHSWFLRENGMGSKGKSRTAAKKNMSRAMKEKIAWDKAQWIEAARTNPELLDLDEFLSFRHPESSAASLLSRVEDVMFQLDGDSDGILQWEEFSLVTSRSVNIQHFFSKAAIFTFGNDILLKKEFEAADKDKTNAIDRHELVAYLDPRNPRQSRLDAEALMQIADLNRNSILDINEILKQGKHFLESKIVDAGKVFHDEF